MSNSNDFKVKNGLVVTTTATILSTLNSISTNSGALQVVGGVGIGGSVFVGGTVTATNHYGNITTNFITTYPAGSNANLLIDPDGAGDLIIATATEVIIYSTTASISTTTGALVVAGGVGIGGNMYVGGTINAINSATTALVVKSNINFVSPDNNSTITVKMLNSDRISFSGLSGQLFSISDSMTGTIFAVNDVSGIPSIEVIDTGEVRLADTFGYVNVPNATAVSSTNSGALRVQGGVGIGGSLYVGGVVTATTFYGNLTGNVTGTASQATAATNLAGGATGSIPYQTAAGSTSFIPIGTSGYVLVSNGSTATWQVASGISSGTATNANNVLTMQQVANATYYPTFVANNSASPGTYNSIYTTSSFSINPLTGFVGIGTTSPVQKLTVTGGSIAIDNAQYIYSKSAASTSTRILGFNAVNAVYLGAIDTIATGGINFTNNGTVQASLDVNGNFGLGVTQSSWTPSWKAIETNYAGSAIASGGAADMRIYSGLRYNSGHYYTIGSTAVGAFTIIAGTHAWFNAPSGTSGNSANLTQVMTLDTNGNLGIGTSSPSYKLDVTGTADQYIRIRSTSTGAAHFVLDSPTSGYASYASIAATVNGTTSSNWSIDGGSNNNPNNLAFYTGNSQRVLIDASGNFGLAITPSAWGSGWTSYSNRLYGEYYSNNGGFVGLSANVYFNGTSWIYKDTTYASRYEQALGNGHIWYNAPSGSVNTTATFVQAMILDASGNLTISASSQTGQLGKVYIADVAKSSAGSPLVLSSNDTSTAFQLVFNRSVAGSGAYFAIQSVEQNIAYRDLVLQRNGGNIGFGTIPSGWSGYKAIDVSSNAVLSGSSSATLASNLYFNGVNWVYKNTSSFGSTAYQLSGNGSVIWYQAPAGTIGTTATLAQTMTLDANGNLLVGYTTQQLTATLSVSGGIYSSGVSTFVGTLTQSGGYVYLGSYNSTPVSHIYPTYGGTSLAMGWNISGGNAEMDIWNTVNPSSYTTTGIRFLQQTSPTTYKDLMFLRQDGALAFNGMANVGSVGQLLQSNGNASPTWVTPTNLLAGTANSLTNSLTFGAGLTGSPGSSYNGFVATTVSLNTATLMNIAVNLQGGSSGAIHYQSSANASTFLSLSGTANSILAAGASAPQYVTQVLANPSGTASYTTSTGQTLVVSSGGLGVNGNSYFASTVGIGGTLYLAGDLYVDGTQFIVNTTTISSGDKALVLSTGSTTAALAVNAGLYIGPTTVTSYISLVYDGNTNWKSSGGIIINTTTNATSTTSGALQVVGGVGIGGSLYVGGVVTATTFYGNLTGNVTGTASQATAATNLAGGATGSIPYQTAAGSTSFIPIGTSGYVLVSNGSTATWQVASGISSGTATNANNVLTMQQVANATYYPTFVSSNTANPGAYYAHYTTSSFSINPATGSVTSYGNFITNGSTVQSPGFWQSGTVTAAAGTAYGFLSRGTLQASTNTDALLAIDASSGVAAVGSSTGTSFFAVRASGGSWTKTGAGSITNAYSIYADTPTIGINNYAAYISGNAYITGSITGTNGLFVSSNVPTSNAVTVATFANVSGTVSGINLQAVYAGSNTTSTIGYDFYGSAYGNQSFGPGPSQGGSWGLNYISGRSGFGNHWFRDINNNVLFAAVTDGGPVTLAVGYSYNSYSALNPAYSVVAQGALLAGTTTTSYGAMLNVAGSGYVSGTLTATTFVGNLTGTATNANNLLTSQQIANATYYPTFVANNSASPGAYNAAYTTSSFSINPLTGAIQVKGAGSSFGAQNSINGDLTVANTISIVNGVSGSGSLTISASSTGGNSVITLSNTGASGQSWTMNVGGINVSGGNGTAIPEGNFLLFNSVSGNALMVQKATNSVFVYSSAATTSTTSGALQVAGGVGIGGGLYVGGMTTSSGITLNGALVFQSANISAAGTTQATATAVTADNTYVTGGTGGVVLPTAVTGREISISNNTASPINVYPASGANIENAAANAATVLPSYATLTLVAKSTTNWWAITPVYNAGSGISISQSANGTVTWSVNTGSLIAGAASQVQTTAQIANANYYPTFVSTNNATAAAMSLYTTSSFVYNPSTGAHGIGNGSPSVKLDVGSNDSTAKAIAVRYGNTPAFVSNSYDGTYMLSTFAANSYDNSNGSASWATFGNTSNGAAAVQLASGAGSANSIRFLVSSAANVTPTEYMRLDASGNLGLGVTPSGSYTLQGQVNYTSGFKGFSLGGLVGGSSGSGYPAVGYNAKFTSTGDAYQYSGSDYANLLVFKNGQFQFLSAPSGTAGAAITFTQAMTLDASGNLGLGVTPSAWGLGGSTALQIRNAGFAGYANNAYVNANAYFTSGGSSNYIATGFASQYVQINGQHQWYTAPSGTAGSAITFTQAMTLDVNGNLMVGYTTQQSGAKLNVNGSAYIAGVITGTSSAYFSGSVGVGTTSSIGKFSVGMSDATAAIGGLIGNINAWDSTYSIFGNVSSTTSGALGIGYNATSGSVIVSLAPSVAWRNLSLIALNQIFYTQGNFERMRITQNGGLAFGGASNYGTSGQILQSTGDGVPTWVNASGISSGTATNANNVLTMQQTANATYYPTFVSSNTASPGAYNALYTTSSFVYNPLTGAHGIGNGSPSVKLDVGSNDSTAKAIAVRYSTIPTYITSGYDGTNGIASYSVNVYDTSAGSVSWSSFSNTSYGGAAIQLAAGSTSNSIRFLLSSAANTNPTERARIDPSGNFIIGATSNSSTGMGGQTPVFYANGYSNLGGLRVNGGDSTNTIYLQQNSNLSIVNGSAYPIIFGTNSAERVRIDSSGNVGIGTTPSSWDSNQNALEFSSGAFYAYGTTSGGASVVQNAYYNAGWKYKYSAASTYYTQISGQHQWYTAPSGTAGNAITFTQAMTLDASGFFGIGAGSTSPSSYMAGSTYGIVVKSATTGQATIITAVSGSGDSNVALYSGLSASDNPAIMYQANLRFGSVTSSNGTTGFAERMRITSSGGVAFGGATNYGTSGQVLQSNGNAAPTWVNQSAIAAGSAPLTNTYVGFGNSSNLLTGSANLTWDGTTFKVTGSGLFTQGIYTGSTTSGVTRGVLTNNGDLLSYYAAESNARYAIGRDTGVSGGAGIALGGYTYALIGTGDTFGTNLYFKLATTLGTVTTSPVMTLASTGLTIAGALYATTKSFLINHPTKPGKKLRYGSLEGPENGVYVRGRLKDSNIIELPEYWTKLVDPDSITVELTPIGKYQKLYVEDIVNNTVVVANDDKRSKSINCFYTVYGERIDVDKLEVEIE